MIYFIDIDGTICTTPNIDGVNRYDLSTPISCRINKINKIFDDGHTIVYYTGRGSGSGIDQTLLTKNQLKQWGCKYHDLRLYKPTYDVWIDDRAINSEVFFK